MKPSVGRPPKWRRVGQNRVFWNLSLYRKLSFLSEAIDIWNTIHRKSSRRSLAKIQAHTIETHKFQHTQHRSDSVLTIVFFLLIRLTPVVYFHRTIVLTIANDVSLESTTFLPLWKKMACMMCSLSTLTECRQCQLLMTWPGLCSICSRPSVCPTSRRLPAASPLQTRHRRTAAPDTDGTDRLDR